MALQHVVVILAASLCWEKVAIPFQVGPSSQMNSLCFLNRGVVRMGGIRGICDDDATGGGDSVSGESSFRFPMMGGHWYSSHSGGVGLSLDNILDSGCLGNRGLV